MTTDEEIARLELEIGRRIDAAVKADPRDRAEIAALLGIEVDSLNKIRAGKSNKQYAKLVLLARILRRSPSQLLGFDDKREIFIGAMEGVFEALGHSRDLAQEISGIVLRVIDTHEFDDRSPQQDQARSILKFLTQQSVDSQRKSLSLG